MIKALDDQNKFRLKTNLCWEKNTTYWLNEKLRHVTDVGSYIVDRTISLCHKLKKSKPTIVDLGFGSAWLYEELCKKKIKCNYIGIDRNKNFIEYAEKKYKNEDGCKFYKFDLEEPLNIGIKADVVVNAFTFFELSNLHQSMENACNLLKDKGTLLISTIDSTYLILAVSESWAEFMDNLRLYEQLPDKKYTFQPIDLDDSASPTLEYPSVLYSRDDFLNTSASFGLKLSKYKEHVFTAKPIPKIYYHLELVRGDI
jgi:2-polyprenyl-3-methyl-5-hydroxy-6-metoxy-1,4-benzoquinol methylase